MPLRPKATEIPGRCPALVRGGSLGIWLVSIATCLSSSLAQGRCFDFNTKVTAPLKAAQPLPASGDAVDTGQRGDGIIWTRLRGTIAKATSRVLALLLNHDTMRDPEVDELQVKKKESPQDLARHCVSYDVRPFPLIKVRWTEEWGYAVADGPEAMPTTWGISYEKTEGTSHIDHFCGNIVLRRLSDTLTDMFQYEESKISRPDIDDQAKALKALLAKLRNIQ